MTSPRAHFEEMPFIGRVDELFQIRRFLQRANGGVFLVSGEEGSGKSALLRRTLETPHGDVSHLIRVSARDRIAHEALVARFAGRFGGRNDAAVPTILIDDAHLADAASLELLARAASHEKRLRLLLAYRPTIDTDAASLVFARLRDEGATYLALRSLANLDAMALIRHLWPRASAPTFVEQADLIEATRGMPGLITRNLRDRNDASIHTRVTLEKLPIRARRALFLLSFFEAGATVRHVHDFAKSAELTWAFSFGALTKEYLTASDEGVMTFLFISDALASAALFPADLRRRLHALRATMLERHVLDARGAYRVARQFQQAGDHVAASTYFSEAARLAEAAHDTVQHLRPIGRLAEIASETASSAGWEMTANFAAKLVVAGFEDEAFELFEKIASLGSIAEPKRLAEVLYSHARLALHRHGMRAASRIYRRIAALPLTSEDAYFDIAAIADASMHTFSGHPERALFELRNIQHSHRLCLPEATTSFYLNRGRAHHANGDHEAASHDFSVALASARASADAQAAARTLLHIGNSEIDAGRYDAAEAHLTEARDLSARYEDPSLLVVVLVSLSNYFLHRGRFSDAQTVLAEACPRDVTIGVQHLLYRATTMTLALFCDMEFSTLDEDRHLLEHVIRKGDPFTTAHVAGVVLEREYRYGNRLEARSIVERTVHRAFENDGYRYCLFGVLSCAHAHIVKLRTMIHASTRLLHPTIASAVCTLFEAIVEHRLGRAVSANAMATKAANAFRKMGCIRDLEFAMEIAQNIAGALDLLTSSGAHRAARRLREVNPSDSTRLSLSSREQQACALAIKGLPNPTIASELHISQRTVENHLQAAYRKLGIRSRYQLREVL